MSIEKKVPEIRYKGFNDQWQEREFSHFATRVSTYHQSTCLPCVEYEDIVAGKGRFNKDIHQKINFKTGLKFEAGDVLFGKLRPYLKNWFLADFEGLAVGDFWVLRANNVTSAFLFSLIQTNRFEFISNLSAGSKMPRSDWGLVSTSCFSVPKHISESNEIGNYFQKLDTLINQHQQKHDKLSNIKKAMLEKMFPKQGKTIPEIRFKGFSGEWEAVTLGDYTTFRRGSFPQPYGNKEWYDGEGSMPFVQVVDVSKGLSLVEDTKQKISVKAQPRSVFVPKGSVVVTLQGTIGRVAITQFDSFVDRTILIFESFSRKTDSTFWAYAIQNKFDLEKKRAPGGTIKTITKDALSSFGVLIPSTEEQIAIGNYFLKLDALTNQHQQQITKLNNIKQACLSKMFV